MTRADLLSTPRPLDAIRVATVPYGATVAVLHPACVPADLDRDEVLYHDLTIRELLDQGLIACDSCGERIVPRSVVADADARSTPVELRKGLR